MDSRHPFSRQPAQPHSLAEDPRYPPIPPPPYSSQRQDLPPHNDPFFPRRQPYENHAASPTKADQPPPYGVPPPPYPPNPFAVTHSHNVNDGRARRRSHDSNTIYDHLRREENENKNGEVPPQADANRIQPVPPPLPIPSSFHQAFVQGQGQYAQDLSRRPTTNSPNAPSMYSSRLAEPSPPPPSQFNSRYMLPPTSPQYAPAQYNSHPQPPRGAPPNIPFARDLPALSAAHRPGSSMSISSMLGQNPDPPSRDGVAPLRESIYHAQTKDSTVDRNSHGLSPSLTAFNRPTKRAHTPDSHTSWRIDQSRARAFSGGPMHRSYPSFPDDSPEAPQTGPPGAPYKVSQSIYELGKSGGTSHSFSRTTDTRRSSIGGVPQTATFQRPGFRTPPVENSIDRKRAPASPESTRTNKAGPSSQRDMVGPAESVYGNHQNGGVQGTPYGSKSRPTNQSQNRPPYETRPEQHTNAGVSSYPFLNRSSQHAPSHEQRLQGIHTAPPTQISDVNSAVGARPDQFRQNDEKFQYVRDSQQSMSGTPQQIPRQAMHPHNMIEEQQMPSSAIAPMQMRKYQNPLTPNHGEREVGNVEDSQPPIKSFLAAVLESSRRGGRISPLPQAVQGAQGRIGGPASEPGIKNEFARMFSGIGSGVGSAMSTPVPAETGPPISFPSSPIRVDESERGTPLHGRHDASEQAKPRVASKGNRRSKKIKDEEARVDGDGEDIALTRSSSSRAPKRPRQSYNLQNLHNNHHHHHVDGSASGSPFAVLKNAKRTFTPNPPLALTPLAAPHHHHHHHHPSLHPSHHHHHLHHHHAAARATPVPVPSLRRPTVTVSSKAVLDSVRDLPRHHLGSKLYAPILSVPSWKLSHEQLRFGYVSTFPALPRFEGKENCTFTIRVPRLYLQKDEREEICQRRALWGSEIYTDDSDPIAAAIHGGWIRGEWGEDVDASMLEPEPLEAPVGESKEDEGTAPLRMTFASPPTHPMEPIKDRDLHITVLILPTLQSYTGLVMHGIKSRSWTSKHDGLSFKVERIEWVDEKSSRGEERGGEARRKRLRALMDRRSGDVGAAFSMNFLARELGAMKSMAVAS